jgi:hypothetical protein
MNAKTADVAARNDRDSKEATDKIGYVESTHAARLGKFDPNVQMVYIPEQEIYLALEIDPHDGGQQHARHPEGLAPEPRSIDNKPEIHQQLKKPLIPENRNEDNDFMNVGIDPHDGGQQHARHPEGLAPEPRSIDNKPEIHQQLKKPLIPENRKDTDDFMNMQIDPHDGG